MTNLDFAKKGPVLFIGCHPDDVELGCGGLINKLRNKIPIYVLTLSKNQKNEKNKNLLEEQKQSLKSLGIQSNNIILGNFITREFSYARQEICDYLWQMNKKINPTTVFIPPYDLHQDHQICNAESLRVFRTNTVLEYDILRSSNFNKPTVFVRLSKKDLDAKLHAISYYHTYKNKNYFSKKLITSICEVNGAKFEIPLSEVFNPVSIIL